MYGYLKFKLNIQLFAENEEKEKTNDLLSYELLKKENEELKKEFQAYKDATDKQLEDIKNVIRSGNLTNGQEKQDNNKDKRTKELGKKLFDELKKL